MFWKNCKYILEKILIATIEIYRPIFYPMAFQVSDGIPMGGSRFESN